ncbi:serine/threonine-protein kinase VRK1 isoform X2 [Anoplophora glabripennis]|nr:serine/threonine-protein kinase VRK1 isoform X2 [Anoplophora glabripennis]
MAKAAPKRKAANGYKLAERLPKGEILEDIGRKKWKLGSPIGQGGFGEIYAAQEEGSTGSNYPYVVKIEPHANGPLFVEMHFYMRNAKPTDIEEFKKEKGLKTFGMPLYLGSGSHEFKSQKYRFVVMEKFGTDLWKIYLEHKRSFPSDTVFKLGIQILDVLEYIHNRGYVHADIKGANVLMGIMKGTTNQAYLIDFGLATKFSTEKEFKPNPKKAHDGTIEYLSRDAHKGVQTRRGDLEILAYNLIQWLGCTLPWESNLKDPNEVHKSKEAYMDNVPKMIKACFGHKTPPGAIVDYLNYLKTLKFNTEPDYKKIRKIFISGIKDAGGSENDPLTFHVSQKKIQKRKGDRKDSVSPKRKIRRGRKPEKDVEDEMENCKEDSDNEEKSKEVENPNEKISQSDIDDEDIIEASDEEVDRKKRGRKGKGDELPKKTADENKISGEMEVLKNKKPLKRNKTEASKKDSDAEENGTADPYEGYTEAMKEVVLKKLKNGKSKGRKDNKIPVIDDNMEGYTDSMKELVLKKTERVVNKKNVKSKNLAPLTNVKSDSSDLTRGSRLRARKDVCYNDQLDSD